MGAPWDNASGPGSSGSSPHTGATYVYRWNGAEWSEQGYLKASNWDDNTHFGGEVALSENGDVLVVASAEENSGASPDQSAPGSGAVYLFRRTGSSWAETALLKAPSPRRDDYFGSSLGLSAAGDRCRGSAPALVSRAEREAARSVAPLAGGIRSLARGGAANQGHRT